MKPTIKKVLIIGGIILGITAILGYNKAQKLKDVFYKLTMLPININSVNFNFQKGLSFKMDVKISNSTADDFFVSSLGAVDLKTINVSYKNNFLATANLKDFNEISIPAKSSVIVKDVDVIVPTLSILPFATTFNPTNFMNDISVSGVLTSFGTDYIIEN